ncbi:hypothetical protein BZA05DRAFT_390512 [Tricharina praecox]|uniref:uncharacterized protein n=1 Tax=Tricharina praecox TaxID=43433 RepID=UPI00222021E9|nr:uncharacterized protein BZA05DRAFT_390512 [Tricharina praecox]KAI5856062.1 hypothetical protein BZA05DRAFT_390512 [Tricharina praecox]
MRCIFFLLLVTLTRYLFCCFCPISLVCLLIDTSSSGYCFNCLFSFPFLFLLFDCLIV